MRSVVVLSAVLILTACASASEAPVDVAPAPSATAPAPAARPVPVLSASFEHASAACNEWATSSGATAIRSVPPRTGDYACKLCGGADGAMTLARRTAPLAAGRYVLSAYVRRRAGLPGPGAAQVVLGDAASALVDLKDDGYALASVAVDVPTDGAVLDVKIAAIASASECFLVDDVLVAREP